MMRGWFLAMAALVALARVPALAQGYPVPLITGPQDVSQMQAIMNSRIITAYNNFLATVYPQVNNSTNSGTVSGSTPGQPIVISSSGSDANVPIAINPKGNGNIILFNVPTDTGLVQLGNLASWYPAQGISACPGVITSQGQPGKNVVLTNMGTYETRLTPANIVRGFEQHLDWLGHPYWLVAC